MSEWISVEDRLPPIDEEVIVAVWDGTLMSRFLAALTADGWYSYAEPTEDDIFKVTHWQALTPVPQPPEDV